MKNYFLLFSLFIGFCLTSYGKEFIDFPDPNFKTALLNHTRPVINTDGNDEISEEEALNIKILRLSGQNISSLEGIEYFSNLTFLIAENNNIKTIDVRSNNLWTLRLSGNPLEFAFLEGDSTFQIEAFYGISFDLDKIQFVCINEAQYFGSENGVDHKGFWDSIGDKLSFGCSNTPDNRIQGQFTYDIDSDGCDSQDVPFTSPLGITLTAQNGVEYTAFLNTQGQYSIFAPNGDDYSLRPNALDSAYFSFDPITIGTTNDSFSLPDDINTITTDYCIQSNGDFNDLEITMTPVNSARPGSKAVYLIIYKNIGTTTQSGSITLDYPEEVVVYRGSNPAEDTNTNNTLTWNFIDLQPMEQVVITTSFILNKPTDTPKLSGGEILNYTATVTAGIDETPENNVMNLSQEVVNSFDPNDITCLEGGILNPDNVGEYLHYLIRFENKGTAEAINIRITDVIDTEKLDIQTLVPLKGSHLFTTTIINNYHVEFYFNNINLPFDDTKNDGYVLFKIKTKDNLQLGDQILNNAAIYFDFNKPIITNTETVTVGFPPEPTCEKIYFRSHRFKRALINHSPTVDTDKDGEISICEAAEVTSLSFTEEKLTGINEVSYFTNLLSFSSYGNALEDVDFNNNTRLKNVVISGIYRSSYIFERTNSVDLSNNTALESLVLIGNSIKNIDLTNKTNLVNIQVTDNAHLRSIDVTDCTALVSLDVNKTHIETIDLSNNHLLRELNVSKTSIKTLDLDNNTALIDLKAFNLYSIKVLDCSNSPDLKNVDASYCSSLKELNVSVNSLNSLNIKDCGNLESLYMKGDHTFYDSDNFEGLQLEDDYYDLELVCIDPIANFDEFESFLSDASVGFRLTGNLTSYMDCSPMYSSDLSDYCVISPNPATDYISIKSTRLKPGIKDTRVYDITIKDSQGNTIDQIIENNGFYYFHEKVSLSRYNLASGIYFLTLNTDIGPLTSSFVKQ